MNPSPIRQAPDQLRSNPIGLDAPSVKATVEELNRTLATLYTLYHQVKKHHWVVEGPEYLPLHEFLDEWAAQLLKDADEVAERITALGGYPVSGPAEQENMALIAMEPEGVYALRAMLEKDLADGGKLVAALRQYAQGAPRAATSEPNTCSKAFSSRRRKCSTTWNTSSATTHSCARSFRNRAHPLPIHHPYERPRRKATPPHFGGGLLFARSRLHPSSNSRSRRAGALSRNSASRRRRSVTTPALRPPARSSNR